MTALRRFLEAASAEVRGRATADELELLASDVEAWRDALHELVADLDRQAERNANQTEDRCRQHPEFAQAERERLGRWVAKVSTFRMSVERRIASLEFEANVRRRRRLDEAHGALAGAVYEVVRDWLPDSDCELTDDTVPVPADALIGLADAYARLEDHLAGRVPVLVGFDS